MLKATIQAATNDQRAILISFGMSDNAGTGTEFLARNLALVEQNSKLPGLPPH
jgi:hypothetical protein